MPDLSYIAVSRQPPRIVIATAVTPDPIPADTDTALYYDVTGIEPAYVVSDRFSGGVYRRQLFVLGKLNPPAL